ncbi:MAG: hypothetical protein ACLFTT_14990 [Candidatus Hydrogenedentota bacterium]
MDEYDVAMLLTQAEDQALGENRGRFPYFRFAVAGTAYWKSVHVQGRVQPGRFCFSAQ